MKRIFSFSLLVAITFTIGCTQTNSTETAVDIENIGAVIKFDKMVHDYGTIVQNADGNCAFVFKNTGTEPLTLSNVRSSCGCTIPSWPREPIAPGESSEIKVKYDTKRIGLISKTITVTSNGSEQPIMLRIKGKILKPEPAATEE